MVGRPGIHYEKGPVRSTGFPIGTGNPLRRPLTPHPGADALHGAAGTQQPSCWTRTATRHERGESCTLTVCEPALGLRGLLAIGRCAGWRVVPLAARYASWAESA